MMATTLLLTVTLMSYVSIAISLSPEHDRLVHHATLDSDEKYHVFWNFDNEIIVFEVQVETLGFVGFGLSSNGDMSGSDIVIGGVYNGDRKTYFTDRYATAQQEPVVDESQDWHLVWGSQNDTHTTLRFWRAMDTCDSPYDREVDDETVRVIWAYNDEDADMLENVRYHGVNRGSKSMFLLNPQKILPEIPEDSLIVDFINPKVSVPESHTTYWCQAFAIPKVDRKHHVIKFEPVIQPGNEWLVHHMILTGCYEGTTNETVGQGVDCMKRGIMTEAWLGCITMIFAWAVGGGPFYFPEHVGFPFGFDEDPSLIILETHFDNPNEIAGLTDSSGLRLTLSPRPRKYDAGIVSTGVVVWNMHMIPPYMDSFLSEGHCVPECLGLAMADQPDGINVFAGFLHAHLLGTGLRMRHFRDGIEQEVIIEDNNYDFDFQETRMLKEEINIKPRDHLITQCYYRSTGKNKVTYGGISTREEMCLSVILYYPRIKLSECQSTFLPSTMGKFANLTMSDTAAIFNTTIQEPPEFRGMSLFEYMGEHVDWRDEATRNRYQEFTLSESDIVPICFRDVESRYKTRYNASKVPEIRLTLSAEKPCVRKSSDGTAVAVHSVACFMIAAVLTAWF